MKTAVVMLMFLATAAVAGPYKAGDRVVAQYKGGEYWYAGTVTKHEGARVSIKYADGTTEALPVGHVRKFDWKVGTKVYCDQRQEQTWNPGLIKKLGGSALHVKYDDGTEEKTTLAHCRAKDEEPPPS